MPPKTDRNGPRAVDLLMALSLLTRLPLPRFDFPKQRPAASAAWAYPLAGLVIAMIAGGLGMGLDWIGMPAALLAGLVLVVSIVLTGAMHEDGLADCADGFWGGWEPERRLEIMKDSQLGSYGALALALSLGLRWTALSLIIESGGLLPAILSAAIVSRAVMGIVMGNLPPVRPEGLSARTGRMPFWSNLTGSAFAIVSCLALLGPGGMAPLVMAMLAAPGIQVLAKRKIGGQTGDVLGATQQVSEVMFLITWASMVAQGIVAQGLVVQEF